MTDYLDNKIRLKFNAGCLKQQNRLTITHNTIVNIYIFYELSASGSFSNDPTLNNSLFGAIELTKNADIDKHRYSGNGIGFDRKETFSFPGGGDLVKM